MTISVTNSQLKWKTFLSTKSIDIFDIFIVRFQDGLTRNDDRILTTCLSLCRSSKDQTNAGTYVSLLKL